MATTTRKRLPSTQRRALIEESAGRLFAERGYAGTRLSDIAKAAQVTKPVLYRHFDSKKDLYLALLARHREDLPTFIERVPADLPAERRIRSILDAWFAYVEEHGYAWRMLFRDTGGDDEIRTFRLEVQDRAREVLIAFIRGQGISVPKQEVEPLAEFLRTGAAGLALWWLDHPEVPRENMVDVVGRVLTALAGARTSR